MVNKPIGKTMKYPLYSRMFVFTKHDMKFTFKYKVIFNESNKFVFFENGTPFTPLVFEPNSIKLGTIIYYDKVRVGICLGGVYQLDLIKIPDGTKGVYTVKILNEEGHIESIPAFRWVQVIHDDKNETA